MCPQTCFTDIQPQAFEKVDQPCEESRKGFMWRLTDEALREGVKSTTRYRSKQPNKRGHRTQHPQPQRQASGAKGGQAARRSANLRRSKRAQNEMFRSEPYCSRSVPAAFDPSYGAEKVYAAASPYYGSEVDFGYVPSIKQEHGFGNNGLDLFPPSGREYAGTPMLTDSAYVLGQSPSESLFTNSPSPSALDEPRTPVSQDGWGEDVGLELGTPFVCEDGMAYQEYAG